MKKTVLLILIALAFLSCAGQSAKEFHATFDSSNDRIWIGPDFWAIPMEEWQVRDGRVESSGAKQNMRLNLLTWPLDAKPAPFSMTVRLGLLEKGDSPGSAGFRFGIVDEEDPSAKSACYFGNGLDGLISTDGKLILGENTTALPAQFSFENVTLILTGKPENGHYLELTATDENGKRAAVTTRVEELSGLVALVNLQSRARNSSPTAFWFDDLSVSGDKFVHKPDNAFGPILWSMYTLSRNVVKLSAQMPPLGEDDNQKVSLQLSRNGKWQTVAEEKIDPDARTALFRLENWNATQNVPYRLVYNEKDKAGNSTEYRYEGTIRRDPVDRPLVLGGLTCQHGSGFPYTPVAENLKALNPDMLYFSGDQIYEGNGGYGIIRFPADRAILSYLGKWYMFGWAFGDVMRDRPTICTPDDHDVFQGNLWGDGGRNISQERWTRYKGGTGGYFEPAQMVNAVHRTQCGHLPDPFEPTPLEQGIHPFYTDLVYGRISFAILTDRGFKSGPSEVAFWPGRPDHVKEKLPDMSVLDRPDLTMFGERQLRFLEQWITDWRGADMKVVLSQTVLSNIATHHGGNKMVLAADLDSGGWPKSARDRAIRLFRKAFAFHINGDQHIPSFSQYGVDEYRDAGWSYCTPAIYVGYERRFQPESLGLKISNPPEHGLPHTGYYKDPFGNLHYVYAMGNPVDNPVGTPRWQRGQDRASGFGVVTFDQRERTINVDAYRYLADVTKEDPANQFQGWPVTISQFDNYGRKPAGFLPELKVTGVDDPVVMVTEERTGELLYAVRIKGNRWQPPVFADGFYSVKIGDPDLDVWKTMEHLAIDPTRVIDVDF